MTVEVPDIFIACGGGGSTGSTDHVTRSASRSERPTMIVRPVLCRTVGNAVSSIFSRVSVEEREAVGTYFRQRLSH